MNYSIISKTGWKGYAQTEADALAKAQAHKDEWKAQGCTREIPVSIYYRATGALVKTL